MFPSTNRMDQATEKESENVNTKRILTITFHRAHNYGSVLQAYALQSCIRQLCEDASVNADCRVLDFNLPIQEQLYSVFKPGKGLRTIAKNFLALPYKTQLMTKHDKFECFIEKRLSLTQRYYSEADLIARPPLAEYYICGSDQIWNIRAKDFSKVYLLDFVSTGKRISYAASCGPLTIDWKKYDYEEIKKLLGEFDMCSVREKGSAENLETLTNQRVSLGL